MRRTSTWEICHRLNEVSFIVGNLSEFVRAANLDIKVVRYEVEKGRNKKQNWCDIEDWRIFWHYFQPEEVSISVKAKIIKPSQQPYMSRNQFLDKFRGRKCYAS